MSLKGVGHRIHHNYSLSFGFAGENGEIKGRKYTDFSDSLEKYIFENGRMMASNTYLGSAHLFN